MRYLLLLIIKIYWKVIPENKRNKCLFKESCSKYVFRITKSKGLIGGLIILKTRFQDCRPGYTFLEIEGEEYLITSNHKIYSKHFIKNTI